MDNSPIRLKTTAVAVAAAAGGGALPSITPDDEKAKRKRKFSTRSRSGCLTCKNRRIRCDETRPKCNHCLIKSLDCVYTGPSLPLKERKALQADSRQAPWQSNVQVWQIAEDNAAADPFDVLPLKMTPKSRELFHYFTQSSDACRTFWPEFSASKSVRVATEDPLKFQSSLLLSGLSYVWRTGALGTFATTHFMLLSNAIKTINKFLENPATRTSATTTKLVYTVCILEAGTFNILAADAHVRGLMSMMDAREQVKKTALTISSEYDAEGELLDKFMLVAFNFNESIKTRMNEARSGLACWRGARCPGNIARINSLLLAVYFMNESRPRTEAFTMAYAEPYINSLRNYHRIPMRSSPPPAEFSKTQGTPGKLNQYTKNSTLYSCGEGSRCVSQTRAMVGFVRSLIETVEGRPLKIPSVPPEEQDKSGGLFCTWNGCFSATICYSHTCLTQASANSDIPIRVLRRILIILIKDLHTMRETMESRLTSREFWLWRAFVGLAMLKKCFMRQNISAGVGAGGGGRAHDLLNTPPSITTPPRPPPPAAATTYPGEFQVIGDEQLQESLMMLQREYIHCFHVWSRVTGVKAWPEARAALQAVVWVPMGPDDGVYGRIWDDAMASDRTRSDIR